MGKRKSITWDHYTSSFKDGVEHGTCKYCSASFRRNATRMTQHILFKCEEVPNEVIEEMGHHFPHIEERDHKSEYNPLTDPGSKIKTETDKQKHRNKVRYHPWPEVETKKNQSDDNDFEDGDAGAGDDVYAPEDDGEVEVEPETVTIDL